MEHTIQMQPSYSVLELTLEPEEEVVAEAGAMVWMSDNLELKTSARGGALSGLKRAVLTGESFFQNTFKASGGLGLLGLAPGQPGDIVAHDLADSELLLEKGAYLASTPGLETNSNFQGFRGLFNEGLFVLGVSGTGTLYFNGYGDIEEVEVDGTYIVDNGHAVAWEPTLDYELTRAPKVRAFLFADQILLRFSGQGKLWVQSRNPRTLADWVYPFRAQKQRQSNE